MNKKKIIAFAIYALIFAAVIAVDQVTKVAVANASGAAGTLSDGGLKHIAWVIPGFIEITYCENVNGAMGIFRNMKYAQTAFIISTVVILAAITAYLVFSKKKRTKWLNVTFALVLSGAIGNFIDRLAITYVRDFIHVILPFGENRDFFPYIFNVADMALVIGAIMLLVHLLFLDKDALFRFGKKKGEGGSVGQSDGAEGERQAQVGSVEGTVCEEEENGAEEAPDGEGERGSLAVKGDE